MKWKLWIHRIAVVPEKPPSVSLQRMRGWCHLKESSIIFYLLYKSVVMLLVYLILSILYWPWTLNSPHRYVLRCHLSHQERTTIVLPQTGRDDLWKTTERARGQNPRGVRWDIDDKAGRSVSFFFLIIYFFFFMQHDLSWLLLNTGPLKVCFSNRAIWCIRQVHAWSADATVRRAAR